LSENFTINRSVRRAKPALEFTPQDRAKTEKLIKNDTAHPSRKMVFIGICKYITLNNKL
jgi:hypothetical protein